jgi:hypothetical protein
MSIERIGSFRQSSARFTMVSRSNGLRVSHSFATALFSSANVADGQRSEHAVTPDRLRSIMTATAAFTSAGQAASTRDTTASSSNRAHLPARSREQASDGPAREEASPGDGFYLLQCLSNSRRRRLSSGSTARVKLTILDDGRPVTAEMVWQWCDETLQLRTGTRRDLKS